ncbi:hypothetical protein [Spirosoma sp. 209]|uniref:hypothetical protein n=1 Tax=Spirosoma sp. 209 TaxID=1955701 RepID=UPI00098D1500|nr:hypothetical protein [Spirosoma sp. 209]
MKRAYPSPFYTEIERLYTEAHAAGEKPLYLDIGKQALTTLGIPQVGSDKDLSSAVSGYFRRGRGKEVVASTRAERLAEAHPFLKEQCDAIGLPIEKTDRYWTKTGDVSVLTVVEKDPVIVGYEEIKRQILEMTSTHAPAYPLINRLPLKTEHLFVADPADPHFGKRGHVEESGEEYNLRIAERRFLEGTEGLIQKALPYNPEKIVFVGGNDIMHVDNPQNTTTGGTRQDTAALWHESYLSALRGNVGAIDRLLEVAPVHVAFCPSNHDFQSGFMLFQNLKAWYRHCRDVTFDATIAPRKYVQYGASLIGFAHGDGANEKDLTDLLKKDAKAAWAQSKYAYWILHHRHHKDRKGRKGSQTIQMEKDHIGVTVMHTGYNLEPEDYCHVEYVRSMSGPDAWHNKSGFTHALQSMEGFIFDPYQGQVGKIHHTF